MSTNNMSVLVLENFLNKVKIARRSNSKIVTLPIHEADELSHNMNLLLLRLLDKMQTEINESKDQEVITISMDGGGFDEKR